MLCYPKRCWVVATLSLVLFALCLPDTLQAAKNEAPPPTGLYAARFEKRDRRSSLKALHRLFYHRPQTKLEDYEIRAQEYWIYVPNDYDPNKSYGLIMWIADGERGQPHGDYLPILDKHDMIWVGVKGFVGVHTIWHRMGLAIDGATNVMDRYNIDAERVYVAGEHRGSKPASRLAVGMAELFRGAYLMGLVDFYNNVPVSGGRRTVWGADYRRPRGSTVRTAQKRSRFVFQVDKHVEDGPSSTRDIVNQGFKAERYQFVHTITVDNLWYRPEPSRFEEVLTLLDAPVLAKRGRK